MSSRSHTRKRIPHLFFLFDNYYGLEMGKVVTASEAIDGNGHRILI